ncbi:hypothetical protein EVG20_g3455 [Dentipellis fragilis]|uniref:Uncharacterized protein n=1 Tax=Dentipellis fragilis TaxID=205917 RepID=A0A4Y9Z1L0_9AGAM|nr:hypothetical protein EVG20_g3455 [Dentipellis fragilis]
MPSSRPSHHSILAFALHIHVAPFAPSFYSLFPLLPPLYPHRVGLSLRLEFVPHRRRPAHAPPRLIVIARDQVASPCDAHYQLWLSGGVSAHSALQGRSGRLALQVAGHDFLRRMVEAVDSPREWAPRALSPWHRSSAAPRADSGWLSAYMAAPTAARVQYCLPPPASGAGALSPPPSCIRFCYTAPLYHSHTSPVPLLRIHRYRTHITIWFDFIWLEHTYTTNTL